MKWISNNVHIHIGIQKTLTEVWSLNERKVFYEKYLAYIYFCGNETSNFGNFSSGLLLGLSIGCNLVGIILIVAYMSENNKEKDK